MRVGTAALPPSQHLPYDAAHLSRQRARRPSVERFNIWPPGLYHRKIGGQHLFSTVVVVRGADHAHIYVAGKTSIQPDGSIGGVNDLRGQIGIVCKGIQSCVEYVGATLNDVVRTVTYVLDIDAYYK